MVSPTRIRQRATEATGRGIGWKEWERAGYGNDGKPVGAGGSRWEPVEAVENRGKIFIDKPAPGRYDRHDANRV